MGSVPRNLVKCRPIQLLLEQLFNLSDFLLDLAADFFGLAFGLQIGVARDLSRLLFDLTFQLMKLSGHRS